MRNRTNILLLAAFFLTLVISGVLLLWLLELIPRPFESDALFYLALAFPAVPCFCLQLLLCRVCLSGLTKAAPLMCLAFIDCLFAVGYMDATGWDRVGWAILLTLSAAPAAGCLTALAARGILWLRHRRAVQN